MTSIDKKFAIAERALKRYDEDSKKFLKIFGFPSRRGTQTDISADKPYGFAVLTNKRKDWITIKGSFAMVYGFYSAFITIKDEAYEEEDDNSWMNTVFFELDEEFNPTAIIEAAVISDDRVKWEIDPESFAFEMTHNKILVDITTVGNENVKPCEFE